LDSIKDYGSDFIRQVSQPFFLYYILKCIIGAAACYLLYILFPDHQFYWSIISVLLVLAPDHHDTVRLSLARMKANIIGAAVGLAAFLLFPICLPVLCASVVVTILVCTFIRLGNATRSALAALIIVLIQQGEESSPRSAYERMICVVAGCLIALIINALFALFFRLTGKGTD